MLRQKMTELREKIIYEASLVEKMLKMTLEGLLETDTKILENALTIEDQINHIEIEIEQQCINMIALYQPEAKDLRTIISTLKINADFERMGDQAVNIIDASQYLCQHPKMKPLITLPNMAKDTIKMLNDALNAFISEDSALAKAVCEFDDVIDAYRDHIARELITYMISDPKNIERSLKLLSITQNLERIADHCTNLAEETIFISEGRVIKHNIQNEKK